MKKAVPFIIGAVVLLLLIVMILGTNGGRPPRRFDHRITMSQHDKIPYGAKVAYDLLPSLFSSATVRTEKAAPAFWDSVDLSESNQAVILLADYFEASRDELTTLADFVDRGNYVFIIGHAATYDASSFFNLAFNADYSSSSSTGASDSLWVRLEKPAFANNNLFVYPGYRYSGNITVNDSTKAEVLGRNENGIINFVRLNKGRGSFFLHSAPLAFSNYFLLHKQNVAYCEQALSVLPKDLRTVVWNEYYLQKPADNKEPNWLGALFAYPSFKWGLLLATGTLLLYLLLGMRRLQRKVLPHQKPINDSLDFVKTLGRLYYDKKDNKNLAEKMATYFLDHVRNRYKLAIHTLDDAFVQTLHYKSGYPAEETKAIVEAIHSVRMTNFVNDAQLSAFHKQLEAFYQNT